MNTLLDFSLIFFVGAVLGWVTELLFRRFFSAKKWINPGFLHGPYLPLYGFGLLFMHLIFSVDYSMIVDIRWLQIVIALLVCGIVMTVTEYIAGLIFIKGMKIKLWDYSDRPGNIQGIICPLFSIIWLAVGALYYFLVNPYIDQLLVWFHDNLAFSFVVGAFYGVFIIDFWSSMKVGAKIRKFAADNHIVISYEELKRTIREKADGLKEKINFMTPLTSKSSDLKENVENYMSKIKEKLSEKVEEYKVKKENRRG